MHTHTHIHVHTHARTHTYTHTHSHTHTHTHKQDHTSTRVFLAVMLDVVLSKSVNPAVTPSVTPSRTPSRRLSTLQPMPVSSPKLSKHGISTLPWGASQKQLQQQEQQQSPKPPARCLPIQPESPKTSNRSRIRTRRPAAHLPSDKSAPDSPNSVLQLSACQL
jgi:hypothetical protein